MNENNLYNVIPAVVEATTLNIVSLDESRATLSTDDRKELTINLVPGTIRDYLVKGELEFAVEGKEDLIETLKICFPKFEELPPEYEEIIANNIKNYELICNNKESNKGTYCIAKITKDSKGNIKRDYIACYRGCEGAFRWVHSYMINNPDEGFKYMSRLGKDCIYKDFEDGSRITYAPYQMTRQDPTAMSARHYLAMSII